MLLDTSLNDCKCGKPVEIITNQVKNKFQSYVACECGMMMAPYSSKDKDKSQLGLIKAWNKKPKKRSTTKKNGLRPCEKCGSKRVDCISIKHQHSESGLVWCQACNLTTDEFPYGDEFLTLDQAIELWNK